MGNNHNDGHDHNDGHNPKLHILIQPNIGLDSDVRHSVVDILNNTLANEAVLTLKTRSAHWNVSGAGFFELHILFDSQYKQLNEISDEIAERVRMLGGMAAWQPPGIYQAHAAGRTTRVCSGYPAPFS